jgi:hypothetical protein
MVILPPLGNEKSPASTKENQPLVEQEMLWAPLLKVKRCDIGPVVLEPVRFGTQRRTFFPIRHKLSTREEIPSATSPGVDVYSTMKSSTYLNPACSS